MRCASNRDDPYGVISFCIDCRPVRAAHSSCCGPSLLAAFIRWGFDDAWVIPKRFCLFEIDAVLFVVEFAFPRIVNKSHRSYFLHTYYIPDKYQLLHSFAKCWGTWRASFEFAKEPARFVICVAHGGDEQKRPGRLPFYGPRAALRCRHVLKYGRQTLRTFCRYMREEHAKPCRIASWMVAAVQHYWLLAAFSDAR